MKQKYYKLRKKKKKLSKFAEHIKKRYGNLIKKLGETN